MHYLIFDYSEDTEGVGTFEAMASTGAAQSVAVRAEAAQVLAWACQHFPDGRGALDEGFEWDYELQSVVEWSQPEPLQFDPHTGQITALTGLPGQPRHTLTLTLSGSAHFCQALTQAFDLG
jgi:ABC-type sugar transport system ATPase subunit